MCITQVTSFRVGDKLYDTEIDAVEAALKNIAAKLLREHPDNLYAGLLKHGEEIGVLIDKKRLLSRTAPATVEGPLEAVPPSVPPSQGSSAQTYGGPRPNRIIVTHNEPWSNEDGTQKGFSRPLSPPHPTYDHVNDRPVRRG